MFRETLSEISRGKTDSFHLTLAEVLEETRSGGSGEGNGDEASDRQTRHP